MSAEVDLSQVPSEMVERVWGWAGRFVDMAATASRGEASPDDLKAQTLDGRLQMWLATRRGSPPRLLCVAFTRLVKWANGELVLRFVALSGEGVDEFTPLMAAIEELAKAKGVTRIQWESRPGWEAKFPDFRRVYVTMEKVLT